MLTEQSMQSTGELLHACAQEGALVAMGAATRWSGMPNASTSFCEHGASSLHSALWTQAATRQQGFGRRALLHIL